MPSTEPLVLPGGPAAPDFAEGSIFFVGTATVIIRYAGFTILTDPNFLHAGDHVHLGYGLRSTRRWDPAMDFEDLPPIDFVVLSHLHEDHFDRLVEERLDRATPILSTPQAAAALRDKGFTAARALLRWETQVVRKGEAEVRVTAMPGKHGPGPLTAALPAVMGSMLEFGPAGGAPTFRLYITGDTLIHDALREIPQRYPEIDLALLHLGGTRVLGIMLTMDARQGVEAIRIVRPKLAIPIHYNDYTVFRSPPGDFVAAVKAAGLTGQVRYLAHGDTYRFRVARGRTG